jgi:uncharacterized protein (TIGR00369 family)
MPDNPAASTPVPLSAIPTAALIERMGISVQHAAAEHVVGTLPVEGNTQPHGLLHGGASCVLAETLGSIGAGIHGHRLGLIAVGIEISATHHRAVAEGLVTGTARAISLGRSLASYEIVITDEQDRRICTARLTCMMRPAPDAGPAPAPEAAGGSGEPG